MTDCVGFCTLEPARFHAVSPSSNDGFGLVFFDVSSCSSLVSRRGDYLVGCPGDSPSPFPLPDGTAGVVGSFPASVNFRTAQPVSVQGSPSEVFTVQSASSVIGVSSGETFLASSTATHALGFVVLPALSAVAVVALSVVLAVRFVSRVRSTV